MQFLTSDRVSALTNDLPLSNETKFDIVWTTQDSPLGPLLLATHDTALVRLAFAVEGFDRVLDELAQHCGTRTVHSGRTTDAVRRQLDEYFDGSRRTFDVRYSLELTRPGFRRTVQEHLPQIPYGQTTSYSALAQISGSPKAVRAVGTACAHNPLPIVVPCHRVVRSDGSFGNYLGGAAAKRYLLSHEDAVAAS